MSPSNVGGGQANTFGQPTAASFDQQAEYLTASRQFSVPENPGTAQGPTPSNRPRSTRNSSALSPHMAENLGHNIHGPSTGSSSYPIPAKYPTAPYPYVVGNSGDSPRPSSRHSPKYQVCPPSLPSIEALRRQATASPRKSQSQPREKAERRSKASIAIPEEQPVEDAPAEPIEGEYHHNHSRLIIHALETSIFS